MASKKPVDTLADLEGLLKNDPNHYCVTIVYSHLRGGFAIQGPITSNWKFGRTLEEAINEGVAFAKEQTARGVKK